MRTGLGGPHDRLSTLPPPAMSVTTRESYAPDQRREQMLAAAVEVICERGFADTRITDVATRAHASPALVIYYFGTKDGLLTAAFRHSEERFYLEAEALMGRQPDARSKLELLVRLTCVKQGRNDVPGVWGLWLDLWVQAFRHPELAKDRAEYDRRWSATIAGIVREGQAGGEFGEVDVDEFAIAFAALMDGLSIQVALEDEVVTSKRALAVAMGYAGQALGFAWPAPRSRTAPSRPVKTVGATRPSGRGAAATARRRGGR
jgi:AcrR family transcriptional regulator